MPISIQDWTGREVVRTYTDEYGAYNALVPSSYSANIPVPSGFDPNMLIVCMNHPGPIPDPAHPGQMMIDPYFLRQYSQFCYVWSFMPGKTSYLDTPGRPGRGLRRTAAVAARLRAAGRDARRSTRSRGRAAPGRG